MVLTPIQNALLPADVPLPVEPSQPVPAVHW
jgi:hypothetical protein